MILKQIAFNILVLFNCLSFSAIGQGVTSFWYFGAQAGIQFVNYSPMAILDNGLQMGAGCSSISNSFSELQFYARPDSIHTKSHQAVDGSGEVLGNPITDQGAMLIPIPNDPGKYLFAHIQVESAVRLLRYSIIEKTFYQPEGIILPGELNHIIEDSVQYKMTAVHHANGRDIWLIFRKFYSNKIIALLIGENGQVSNPIVSIVDSTLSPGGQLKASPNGEFLADVHSAESGNNFNASIFLFNNETGSISDEIRIENECEYAYGVEFSRNSRFLYFSSNNSFPPSPILRMDISIYDSSSVLSSLDTIDTGYYWSMQLGIDGKIYLSKAGEPFLSRIDNPDEVNPGSVLVNHSAVSLNGRIAANGLPDFVTSFFNPVILRS